MTSFEEWSFGSDPEGDHILERAQITGELSTRAIRDYHPDSAEFADSYTEAKAVVENSQPE